MSAPLGEQGDAIIGEVFGAGINYFCFLSFSPRLRGEGGEPAVAPKGRRRGEPDEGHLRTSRQPLTRLAPLALGTLSPFHREREKSRAPPVAETTAQQTWRDAAPNSVMLSRKILGGRVSGLRIYGIARTRAFRALWMADELGLDYEHLPIEIGEAGAGAPAFRNLNPNGRLPFIVDNGFVLFESLAITLYLGKKHSNGKLYPAGLEDEAKTWQWTSWALTEVDRGVNIWSLHAVRLPPAERDAAKRDEALKVLAAPFRVLDAALAGQPYLLGEEFTVADLNRISRLGSRAAWRGRPRKGPWPSRPRPTMRRRWR